VRRRKKTITLDPEVCEILLTPDGRILVHNLTSSVAALLAGFDPGDARIISRTVHSTSKS